MAKYTYKFSDGGFDYYRDNTSDQIIKIPSSLSSRTDINIKHHAINAEQEEVVYNFFS